MSGDQPTLSELLVQRTALDAAIAAVELDVVNAARAELLAEPVTAMAASLAAHRDGLTAGSLAAQQIGNVINILSLVPQILEQEAAARQATIDAANPPEEPPEGGE